MVNVHVYSAKGEKTQKTLELPVQFSERARPDVIKRAVIAAQNNRRQGYGPDPESGQRTSAKYKGTRKGWGHSYSYGRARLPRLLIKKGGRRAGQTKIVPQSVGGRAAHAPIPYRNFSNDINIKERRLAIRSAITATADIGAVIARGHRLSEKTALPFIVEADSEKISKTKDFIALLEKLGLAEELERGKEKTRRAGKGKMRGRPYKKKKSVLFIYSDSKPKGATGIPGIDSASVKKLSAELLAPGGVPGRVTVWSEGAIEKLKEEGLYTNGKR